MKNLTIVSFLLVLLCSGSNVFSQSPRQIIDSLKSRVEEKLPPDQLANMYGELGWQYAAINLDSAIFFGKMAVEKAEEAGEPKILAQAYSDLGSGILQKGNLDESKVLYLRSLQIREQIQDSLGMAKSYNALGFIHQRKYETDSAIGYFLKALPIFQKEKAELNAAAVLNNLGVIYQNLPDYQKAKQAYEEAIAIRERLEDFRSVIGSYNNLGTVYKYLGDFDQAETYFRKAIAKSVELEDPMNQAISYRIYAMFLLEKGDLDNLEDIARKGLVVARQVNTQYEVAALETALGSALNAKGKFREAKPLLIAAAKNFQEQGSEEDVLFPYFELISVYASLGQADSSRFYSNLYQQTLRTKVEKESKEIVAELETKYQTELKDLQIAEQQLQIKNQNLMIFGSLGLALILAVVGYLLYSQQKLKNRQLQQEGELKAALAQLETQNKLQEQRMLISRDLHDNIGAQLTFIISAIENLKYFEPIKEQLTSRYDSIANFTKQTITELRDTIWAMNSGQVTWDSLILRIQDYLQKARESKSSIQFDCLIEENIDRESKMNSSDSIQILRIVQEAVQNAVRYSDASRVEIKFHATKKDFVGVIHDNGKGFDQGTILLGNGLYNMQKRAEELGGKVEIKSGLGQGTSVKLSWPSK
ncbi:histidine kinase [Algoriphagus aquaeductus]|uniref:histidine kinase n=1 Tax=Algoriphagus aquaeductus TaxID=475299 RepID=A0A326S198_9BACT|nr:tetratricopeptide repeat protein [Algoriphagus aquaeductus]PZV83436.1 histidine kinase [Algoriphagus aquaeductus]